jgi:hypothetical protein
MPETVVPNDEANQKRANTRHILRIVDPCRGPSGKNRSAVERIELVRSSRARILEEFLLGSGVWCMSLLDLKNPPEVESSSSGEVSGIYYC